MFNFYKYNNNKYKWQIKKLLRWDFILLGSSTISDMGFFIVVHSRLPKWYTILYIISNISLFYYCSQIVFPFIYNVKKVNRIPKVIFLFLVGLSIFVAFFFFLDWITTENFSLKTLSIATKDVIIYSWKCLYVVGLSALYFYIEKSKRDERNANEFKIANLILAKENAETANELLRVQNDFLKSQANTHLLFNTLLFIYQDIAESNPKAASTILSLSDYMQYSLVSVEEDGKVLLEEELQQVERYINLNIIRYHNPVFLSYENNVGTEYLELQILPLLLTPFIENLFKYAELHSGSFPASIVVGCENGVLKLCISNHKKAVRNRHSFGIGIENVLKRLSRHYQPGSYFLKIENGDLDYSLEFILNL